MTEKLAMQRRLIIEQMLIREYEDQLVEMRHAQGPNTSVWGRIKTIGVQWAGADQFEVIINLEGRRLLMPYEAFIDNTKVL